MTRINATRYALLFGINLLVLLTTGVSAQSKHGFELADAAVPAQEIVTGGANKDGIPSLDHPQFVTATEARFLRGHERVLAITFNGIHRAYPIKILNYHEIVNDVIGGTPVLISYCPLCGSGMAFLATYDGQRLVFGVSGLLYNNDVLLYDRQSQSLWSQIMSEAISGPMLGTRLTALAVSHTTWRDWRKRYPDSQVLSADTGFRRDYDVDLYPDYARSGRVYFPLTARSRLYRSKEMVLGLEVEGKFKAYPFKELKLGPAHFFDQLAGKHIDIQYDQRNRTARVFNERGSELATVLTFWFAWYAFHPDTAVYVTKK